MCIHDDPVQSSNCEFDGKTFSRETDFSFCCDRNRERRNKCLSDIKVIVSIFGSISRYLIIVIALLSSNLFPAKKNLF